MIDRAVERLRIAGAILRSYVRVRRLLRRGDLPTVVAALRKRPGRADGTRHPVSVGLRLGRAVTRTLRLVPGDTRCLTRSLVLLDLLAARAIDVELVIGVAPGDSSDGFGAHAWVERDGVALLRDDETNFPRIVTI